MADDFTMINIDKRILREDYRNYDLLSRYWHGSYRGRAWFNKAKLVDLEGNSIEEIIESLKGFVDKDLMTRQRSKAGSEPMLKDIVEGLAFIIPRLTAKQQELLKRHRKAYLGKISLNELMTKVGYPSTTRVFQDYVAIANKLSDALAYIPANTTENEHPSLSLIFENSGNINQLGQTTLTLRKGVLNRLKKMELPE